MPTNCGKQFSFSFRDTGVVEIVSNIDLRICECVTKLIFLKLFVVYKTVNLGGS